ncbi:LmeA family phospholipid-binding protein [Candidatus Mycolicibacterium alkanivorans]|uniref:DUF2993 domain-containing protein n=1 Tax=Candidatus Mycolicibacterium alkanivorans TaxID=2954114 RepID=A0ABS9YQR3_9MYCO|nr:DUF2993 domain-containing protein [Candidatus Mycolicibacterium alkanivorans]MCI4673603.1 DUF2993 domain-containing protein [Candidatus Mycolicibacterium alkanivorans]
MTYPPRGPNHPFGPGDRTAPAWPAVAQDQPTQFIPQPGPPSAPPPQEPEEPKSGFLRDPLSIVLALVIVVALVIAGLLGVELYVRHKADTVVAQAVECVVKDGASVSFGMRPLVLQHLSGHYSDINVETAGNQIREAKGMKLNLVLDDIKIQKTADSAGTLGSLDATITWSSDGIKQTLQNIIPIVGGLVTGVSTSPSDGTIELRGGVGTIKARPEVSNGSLNLQVVSLSGLGFLLPRETVQPAFDAFTTTLTKNLPMGIHADSVAVTDTGVTAKFVTRDATIPNGQQDPCFAGI